jgi:hypothetical protein
MTDSDKIIITMLALSAACAVYARILDRHPHWYIPDGTVYTVIAGNGLICIALTGLELWGVPLHWWTVILGCIAGGIPIYIWQQIQKARNHTRREASRRQGGNHP